MLQFFSLLDSGMVVTMSPCGFIPVWLSIFRPDMVTSIPPFKLLIYKWLQSLCPGTFFCLKFIMVGWIVGSARFAVSYLSLFAILTHPPISVVGNKIWAGCSITIIQFLVILFPGRVAIIDSSIRLSGQVKKKSFCYRFNFFLTFIQFFACVCFNCSARNYTLIFLIFVERNLTIFLEIFLSPIFFLCGGITSLSTVMFIKTFNVKYYVI